MAGSLWTGPPYEDWYEHRTRNTVYVAADLIWTANGGAQRGSPLKDFISNKFSIANNSDHDNPRAWMGCHRGGGTLTMPSHIYQRSPLESEPEPTHIHTLPSVLCWYSGISWRHCHQQIPSSHQPCKGRLHKWPKTQKSEPSTTESSSFNIFLGVWYFL